MEEEKEINEVSSDNQKFFRRRYWKFILGFFGVIIAVFGLYVIGFWVVKDYEHRQIQKGLNQLVEDMKRAQKEDYERAMADTYGGKTPQETLRMYIDAVSKKDYELASKYFIIPNQEKELKSLKNSPKENIQDIIRLLKLSLNSSGSYSWDKKEYGIDKPLSVDFKIYPNGIWKIIEI